MDNFALLFPFSRLLNVNLEAALEEEAGEENPLLTLSPIPPPPSPSLRQRLQELEAVTTREASLEGQAIRQHLSGNKNAAQRQPAMASRPFKAKFPGKCSKCMAQIKAGQLCHWDSQNRKLSCTGCA